MCVADCSIFCVCVDFFIDFPAIVGSTIALPKARHISRSQFIDWWLHDGMLMDVAPTVREAYSQAINYFQVMYIFFLWRLRNLSSIFRSLKKKILCFAFFCVVACANN